MTEELLKKLHTAMCNDNEHQCNRLNNYIHTDEYLTAEVVQVVREIVTEETKELQEENKELKIKVSRLESYCNAYNYSQRTYQEEIKDLKELYKKADENWWNAQQTIKELKEQNNELEQKLEQTEKDLADYQFNYPTIKKLQKENEILKGRTEEFEKQILGLLYKYESVYKRFPDLKSAMDKAEAILKENAELKADNAEWEKASDKWKNLYELTNKQLTEAKELLAKWVELYKPKLKDFPKPPIQVDTEAFLKE